MSAALESYDVDRQLGWRRLIKNAARFGLDEGDAKCVYFATLCNEDFPPGLFDVFRRNQKGSVQFIRYLWSEPERLARNLVRNILYVRDVQVFKVAPTCDTPVMTYSGLPLTQTNFRIFVLWNDLSTDQQRVVRSLDIGEEIGRIFVIETRFLSHKQVAGLVAQVDRNHRSRDLFGLIKEMRSDMRVRKKSR